jgi:hypothetical protein
MSLSNRFIVAVVACSALFFATSSYSFADQYTGSNRTNVLTTRGWANYPSQTVVSPSINGSRPIGSDWWRTYPWSPYNAWKNPYWYPPYNTSYPFAPYQAYPYRPYYPGAYPVPYYPWGIGAFSW